MKKTIFLIFTMALTTVAAFAQNETPAPDGRQPHMSPEERAKKTVDDMNAAVQLTPDQASKLLELNKTFNIQRDALRTNGQQMTEEQKTQMQNMRRDKEAKTKAILTPDQWQKWQIAMRQQRGNKMHGE